MGWVQVLAVTLESCPRPLSDDVNVETRIIYKCALTSASVARYWLKFVAKAMFCIQQEY